MHSDSRMKSFLYGLALLVPDKLYLSLKYYKNFKCFPNWKSPATFNEKINWLKVYDHNPLYTTMVDKDAAKRYVEGIIGSQYIIPTLGVWDKAEDIDFDSLPDRFVLKATHDSGRVVICKDKSKLDRQQAIAEMNMSLKRDFYSVTREWPYKNVPRKIIAEQFMEEECKGTEQGDADLSDYKFYCFNGEPTYCQVIRDRSTTETIDFYDMGWNHMPFVGLNPIVKNGKSPVPRPECLELMIDVARKLSQGLPFSRIDLYVINGKVYFGEITFYPNSGVGRFTPAIWNRKLGDLITLPQKR